jgi:hypothetical protein
MHIKQKNHIPAICSELGTASRKEVLKTISSQLSMLNVFKYFNNQNQTQIKLKKLFQ